MSQSTSVLRRNGFTFKQFFVAHDRCAMKVGTDGILLGAWAPVAGVKRCLDIGAGSGLLAFSPQAGECFSDRLVIRGPDQNYSEAYTALTQAFYLFM